MAYYNPPPGSREAADFSLRIHLEDIDFTSVMEPGTPWCPATRATKRAARSSFAHMIEGEMYLRHKWTWRRPFRRSGLYTAPVGGRLHLFIHRCRAGWNSPTLKDAWSGQAFTLHFTRINER